ncbi:hypothetical protein IE53DRAFT_117594 [Violaceomyces palustris]|uniref:Uncharacterized protein n=1 Tax=Violaceomyces palustris TaxID=1673888 RepID=A0ACD0P6N3_9BASI|nr:hypothetical protein IE53DRAFT_117594 [Violaceomyces palustris]
MIKNHNPVFDSKRLNRVPRRCTRSRVGKWILQWIAILSLLAGVLRSPIRRRKPSL